MLQAATGASKHAMRRRAQSADGVPRHAWDSGAGGSGDRRVTYVTAYFTVDGSKYPPACYTAWATRLLTALHAPLVIYTEAAHVAALTAARAPMPPEWTTLVLLEGGVRGHPLLAEHGMDMWAAQHALDPEAALHASPLLYVLWNGKAWLVEHAIQRGRALARRGQPQHATPYYAWVDIGLLRDECVSVRVAAAAQAATLAPRVAASLGRARLALLNIEPFTAAELGAAQVEDLYLHLQRVDRIGGGVMAGHVDAWAAWLPAYRDTLRRLLARGYFVGKDQTVMAVTALDTAPRVPLLLQPRKMVSTAEMAEGGYGAGVNASWSYLLLWLLDVAPCPIH